MRIQKIILTFVLFFSLSTELLAGITGSAALGFGRYRNENGPEDAVQPVGFTWGLAAGYRYSFAALEGMYFKFKGCADNELHYREYQTCARDRIYGVLTRIYFLDIVDVMLGYAEHNVTHSISPANTAAAQNFAYVEDNKHSGLVYGFGAKTNIAPNIEGFFDIMIFLVGNGGERVSSEVDLFMAGIRADF